MQVLSARLLKISPPFQKKMNKGKKEFIDVEKEEILMSSIGIPAAY